MATIEIIDIDLDSMDLDDETRVLIERCIPDEPVDLRALLSEQTIAEAMRAADLVQVH